MKFTVTVMFKQTDHCKQGWTKFEVKALNAMYASRRANGIIAEFEPEQRNAIASIHVSEL